MNQIAQIVAEPAQPHGFMLADAPAARASLFPEPAAPEAGWAAANPMRAMALLYVAPTDAFVEELFAA